VVISDAHLRNDRLVFYTRDVQKIETELDGFLELSGARSGFLIDKEGHMVTRRGELVQNSLEAISALIAGSFAATREMARLLGESQFSTLFHQGQRDSIQVTLVGDRALFATVFDGRTNLGLVRYYATETAGRLATILNEMLSRPANEAPPPGDQISSDFSSSAAAALDKLF
jgi:predicted regulator of Ras-like GTPase activity (Roadblock/LC7/MglB family)